MVRQWRPRSNPVGTQRIEERTTWSGNFGGPSVQLRVHDQGLVERLGVIDHDFVDGDVIKTKSYMQPTDGQQQQVYKMPQLTTPHHTPVPTTCFARGAIQYVITKRRRL